MIAIDSGFLFALADRRDAWHRRAMAQAGSAAEGWITTWPVLTETCHLLGRALGPEFAAALTDDVANGSMAVWPIDGDAQKRIPALMRKYAQLPMDLADASLVLLAEYLNHGQILSTDSRDFKTYRWKNRKPFHNLLESTP